MIDKEVIKKPLKTFPATCSGCLVAILTIAAIILFDIDPYLEFRNLINNLKHPRMDGFGLLALIIALGIALDMYRRHLNKQTHDEEFHARCEIILATMRNVQDITNNAMNHLILFTLEARENGKLSEESIRELEELIQETSRRINTLANLETIDQLAQGMRDNQKTTTRKDQSQQETT